MLYCADKICLETLIRCSVKAQNNPTETLMSFLNYFSKIFSRNEWPQKAYTLKTLVT